MKQRSLMIAVIILLLAGNFGLPVGALADHKTTHTVPGQEKKQEKQEEKKATSSQPAAPSTPAAPATPATPAADTRPATSAAPATVAKPAEEKKAEAVPKAEPKKPEKAAEAKKPETPKAAKPAGLDGKKQQALAKFPDFAAADAAAVKDFQKRAGLPETGSVDDATTRKLNEIERAIERKQPPKISALAPAEISLGTKVTVSGSGFTLEGNSLFVRGKVILGNLTSTGDGAELTFAIPADIPCEVGAACPIKITNSNGISNAEVFKLVEATTEPPADEAPQAPQPGDDGTVTVLAPNGGEVFEHFIEIQWAAQRVPPNWLASVWLKWGNLGDALKVIADTPNDGTERWDIPNIIVRGRAYKIMVEVCNEQKTKCHSDTSDDAFDILNQLPVITPADLSEGTVGQVYSAGIIVKEGVPPLSWSVAAGALPPGLSLATVWGQAEISGTPTAPGTFSFTAKVSDRDNINDTEDFSIKIVPPAAPLVIGTDSLPAATVQMRYSATLNASGGVAPYTWRLNSGALPVGLALDSKTGAISGLLQYVVGTSGWFASAGTTAFTFEVADAKGTRTTKTLNFTVKGIVDKETGHTGIMFAKGRDKNYAYGSRLSQTNLQNSNQFLFTNWGYDFSNDSSKTWYYSKYGTGAQPDHLSVQISDLFSPEVLSNALDIQIQTDAGPKTVYFPAVSACKYHWWEFYVAKDGSTYFGRRDHGCGYTDLSPEEALVPQHLARGASEQPAVVAMRSSGISAAEILKVTPATPLSPVVYPAPTVSLKTDQMTVTAGKPFTLTVSGTSEVGLAAVWWGGRSTGVTNATVVSTFPASPTSATSFTTPVTNPTTLDRAFGSPLFSAAQAVKSHSFTSTVTIPTAGTYEFFANSRDVLYPTFGEAHQASEGAGLASLKITVLAPPAPPALTSLTPAFGAVGNAVTILGKGFTAAGNEVHFVDLATDPHGVVNNVPSADGTTLDIVVPNSIPCSEVENCTVYVKNANGISNSLTFFRTLTLVPVQVYAPNGGETAVQGQTTTLHYAGGNLGLYVGIAEESATTSADPSAAVLGWVWSTAPGDRTIGWDGKTLCGFPGCNTSTQKWTIGPGRYKVVALSHNEFGKAVFSDSGTGKLGNFDLSDQAFEAVAPLTPSITVISPNGGEAYKFGQAMTITWQTKNIVGQSVRIGLFRGINQVVQIADKVPQSAADGTFLYNWVIPNNIPAATDYTIRVNDAASVALIADFSDGPFRISPDARLTVLSPNGGESAMRGFAALLWWDYSGYSPQSINVNLYQNGVFYRSLATGVKPTGFSGSTILNLYPNRLASGNYARYAEIPLPPDLPEGDDYTLQIVDGVDSALFDKSDASFRIVSLASPITFQGRMVDAVSGAPIANAGFGGYSSAYPYTLPRFSTNSNGEFSYTTSTAGLISQRTSQTLFYGGNGPCNNITTGHLYRSPDMPRASLSNGWFSFVAPYSTKQYPLTASTIDFGDIPLWPTARQIQTFTDIPAQLGIYYQKSDGTIGGGGGNIGYRTAHTLSYPFPLGFNVRIQFTDKAGTRYVSPFAYFGTDVRCPVAALSYMDGTFQWEPYALGLSGYLSAGTVGTDYKATLKTYSYAPYASAGIAPYTWGLTYGALPPGLAFNTTTGEISGTPATAGTYTFGIRVTDGAGVRAATDVTLTIK